MRRIKEQLQQGMPTLGYSLFYVFPKALVSEIYSETSATWVSSFKWSPSVTSN